MKAWLAVGVLLARVAAAAPARERCEAGARFAARGDLPRAALYLDGCDELDEFARTVRDVKQRLEASRLSTLDIETTPPGLVAEVDSLPGERLTTPATVWVRAGRHEVRIVRDGAPPIIGKVDVAPHARATIVLEAPKPPPPPHAGHVDFSEEAAGNATPTGPPPPVKHPPMLSCKYTRSCAASGVKLDDPLAAHAAPPPPYPRHALALLAGGMQSSDGLSPWLGAGIGFVLPWQAPATSSPFVFEARGAWARTHSTNDFEASCELEKVFATDTAWLGLGLGPGYSSYEGAGAVALLDLNVRRLPVGVGLMYRQAFEGWSGYAVILQLAVRAVPFR